MILNPALLAAALILIFLVFIWKVLLPVYAFKFVLARKDPETARKMFENYFPADDEDPALQSVPWIDTVDREIATITSYDGLKLQAYFAAARTENADTVIL
ncbi:MAG: hypothetical protein LBE74_07515, partial [Treponema sp.]|nr:hypothetical protein [Treponema sp.]